MSFARRAWKSSRPGRQDGLARLALLAWLGPALLTHALLAPAMLAPAVLAPAMLAALSACAPVPPAAPAPTPTGPMLPEAQAIAMGLKICGTGRVASPVEPELDSAELTTNQAIATHLGRPSWPDLPADSPIWLVKFTGAFTIARPPSQGGTAVPALGPFPNCWAIIEARTGARGTVFIPEK